MFLFTAHSQTQSVLNGHSVITYYAYSLLFMSEKCCRTAPRGAPKWIQATVGDPAWNTINPKGLQITQPSRHISVRYETHTMHNARDAIIFLKNTWADVVEREISWHRKHSGGRRSA